MSALRQGMSRSAQGFEESGRRPLAWLAGLLCIGLVGSAVAADAAAPHASWWSTGVDIGVGLAFLGAGFTRGCPGAERALIAGVGVAWLVGSTFPVLAPVHQSVLAVALLAFPTGRIIGPAGWLVVGGAIAVGLRVGGQIGAAALFAAVAAALLLTGRADRPSGSIYPWAMSILLAVSLAGLSAWGHFGGAAFDPMLALLGYELVLLVVAGTFPLGAQAAERARQRLTDRVLTAAEPTSLDALTALLADVLGDRTLRLERGPSVPGGHTGAGTGSRLVVRDSDGRVAVVTSVSPALQDPPTAAAVAAAVRLAVRHVRLLEDQQDQLQEFERARSRLLAAADRERERARVELNEHVETALDRALSELQGISAAGIDPTAVEAFDVARDELIAARNQLSEVVAGIPGTPLGDGRLHLALGALASSSPIPMSLAVSVDAASTREVESALYYVCSEAVTNAVKHSRAQQVHISVRRERGVLAVAVTDDGIGGADPTGSGLRGLADRLAAQGGALQVRSPPGGGTTLTATIPSESDHTPRSVTRSSSTP